MSKLKYQILLSVYLVIWSTQSFGAVPTYTGTETNFWKSHAIILAECLEVEQVKNTRFLIQIRPLASFAGEYDPSQYKETSLHVNHALGFVGPIRHLPLKGQLTLIVIELEEDRQLLNVPICRLTFMPKQSPILVLQEGFKSKSLWDVVKRVRSIRIALQKNLESQRKGGIKEKGS